MLTFLFGQFHCFFIMSQVFANFDCCFNVKEITLKGWFWKKIAKILDFLFFDVTVQQKGSVLFFGNFSFMHFLKILNQKIDLGNVQILSNDVRRLYKANCENVLFNCIRKFAFGVQRVAVKSWDLSEKTLLTILVFGKSVSFMVKRSLEESFDLERIVPFN